MDRTDPERDSQDGRLTISTQCRYGRGIRTATGPPAAGNGVKAIGIAISDVKGDLIGTRCAFDEIAGRNLRAQVVQQRLKINALIPEPSLLGAATDADGGAHVLGA